MKKKTGLYIMAGLYIVAGVNHFISPFIYVAIIPHWLSQPLLLVYISGVFELMCGSLLLLKPATKIAAWGIILLLIAVFPANIQMTINYYNTHNPYLWLAILRLPLQFVLIWWAYQYTKNKSGKFIQQKSIQRK